MTIAATLDVIVGADTGQLGSGLRDADRQINNFAQNGENRIGRFAARVGAIAGGAFIGIGAFAINAASEWESAFADVEKTVDASAEELAELEDILRNMATDEVLGSLDNAHTSLAQIAAEAGALGVETSAIDEFTESVAALDVASDLTAESAANFAARFANVTGLDIAADIDNLADTIVTLGNNMAATETEIAAFGERMASLSAFGWNPADILGYAAAMASLGLTAELGSTNFIKSVTDMTTAVANSTPELEVWAATAGMTADEFTELANSDPEGAFNAFLAGLAGMDIDEQLQTLNALGITGQEQQRTLLTLAEGYDTVTQGVEIANEAWAGNGAAMAEAQAKADTLQGATNRLHNTITELGIELGEKFVPGLADVADGFSEILDGNPDEGFADIGTGMKDIASGIGEIVTGVEGFDFQSTIDEWNFVWMALQAVTQDILQDVRLFFLNLEREMLTGLLAVFEATNVNGINDEPILGLQTRISAIVDEEQAIAAARQIEDDVNAQLASGEPINLEADVTFTTASGETFTMNMQDLLLNPEILAELDPMTLETLRTQVEQEIQDAVLSGDSTALALNMTIAANLGMDADQILADATEQLETDIAVAVATGDQAALDALIPAAIALGIDVDAIVNDVLAGIDGGLAGAEVDATVTANITIVAGEVVNEAAATVIATINGMSTSTTTTGTTGGGGSGGMELDEHHSGGIFKAPHGQSEAIALLEDGEVIRTQEQEAALGSRMGQGMGGNYNVTVYGSSPYEVLEMTRRAARDEGYG
jgi:TP901 family phage tail tape measure protein